jgi:hypothetical protein
VRSWIGTALTRVRLRSICCWALGSETNFFDNAGIRDWAVTMKNLNDAALLRNRMVAFLEEATLEKDEAAAAAMADVRDRRRRFRWRGNSRRGQRLRARDGEVLSAFARRGDFAWS